jgi:hypothetical protein
VPRPIAVSRGRRRKIRRTGKSGEALDGAKSLKDVAEDANCVAEKKIEAAARAREEALRKAVVARRAVELATNALDFVARRHESGEKEGVVDDAEMAFRLHRAMNSSPRTSRKLLVRGSGLRNPSREVCTDNKSVSEHLYQDGDSSTDVDCPKPDGRIDVRTGEKDCDAEDENVGVPMKEGEVSYSIKLFKSDRDDNSMDSANRSEVERYKGKPNRYLLKYCRRNRRPEATLDRKSSFSYDGFHLVNQASAAGLLISCSMNWRRSPIIHIGVVLFLYKRLVVEVGHFTTALKAIGRKKPCASALIIVFAFDLQYASIVIGDMFIWLVNKITRNWLKIVYPSH